MKFIDLTREINNETQVCPCDKVPVVENYATTEEEGVNVKFMKMGTHTSTHIDAPYHISKSGKTLNDFPVERFIGQGIVLDFSDKGDIYEITREDIMAHADELKKVDFAILNTGWAKYYGTWDFFRHPYLSGDAALALVELGIKIVGDGREVLPTLHMDSRPQNVWKIRHSQRFLKILSVRILRMKPMRRCWEMSAS